MAETEDLRSTGGVPSAAAGPSGILRVATYNVNSVRARAELLQAWLPRAQPDILCLQETKVTDAEFPLELFTSLNYRCWTHGQPGYNGVAICSRVDLDEVQSGIDELQDRQARLLTASVGPLRLVNVYVPHGDLPGTEKFRHKLEFFGRLRQALQRLASVSEWLMVVGDLNVAHTDLDVWDPEALAGTVGVLPEERAAFQQLLDSGLVDCYRRLYPEGRDFTWWDYRGAGIWKNQGMRIDYVLASPRTAACCLRVSVDLWARKRRTPRPSDHAPVMAEFAFPWLEPRRVPLS
ncbi:MAG: exodeoxyribonuclease III [candidate division KSB1 bacterium]|nr:exodeoxyribonuclease III [candidate division KSB1 bacterium]